MKTGNDWEMKKLEFEDASDDAILKRWELKGQISRSRGTLLHFHCEQMMNGDIIENPSPEFTQAQQIYEYILKQGFEPYQAEVNIFHCGLRVAGQPDALMKNKHGEVIIIDWKRTKSMKTESRTALKYPLEHIPDSNYWLYALQVTCLN